MTIPKADFKAAAIQTYNNLVTSFPTEGAFWRAGHSFDTIVDYYLNVDRTGPALSRAPF
jgi:hypothetical protein